MEAFFDRFNRIPIFQKALGMMLIYVVLIVASYFLIYTPLTDEQVKINGDIRALEKSLSEKRGLASDLSKYKREVEKLDHELQRALKLLPNKSEIPSLLQKISSLAKKSGLEIILFQPSAEIPQDFYAKVPVTLKIKGSYNEITNFFDATGKLSRIVNIGNFSFAEGKKLTKSDHSTKKLLVANCVATTFRFIPK